MAIDFVRAPAAPKGAAGPVIHRRHLLHAGEHLLQEGRSRVAGILRSLTSKCNGMFPTDSLRIAIAVLVASISLSLAGSIAAHEITDQEPQPAEPERNDVPALMQKWRSSGNDAYLDSARSIAEVAIERHPHDVGAMLDLAVVAQAQHQFDDAERLTREALSIDNRNDRARLLLASIHLVRGEADAALGQCNALAQSPIPVVVTCRARVAHARSEPQPSLGRLERLAAIADQLAMDDDVRAWMLGVAGDLAVTADRAHDALGFFRRSLELVDSAQVRAAMADVLLELDRFGDVVSAIDADSHSLALVVRRQIAMRGLGRSDEIADSIRQADHRFQHWIGEGDWVHAREMARFYIDVLPRRDLARELAAINIAIQSEPEDKQLVDRTRVLPGRSRSSS